LRRINGKAGSEKRVRSAKIGRKKSFTGTGLGVLSKWIQKKQKKKKEFHAQGKGEKKKKKTLLLSTSRVGTNGILPKPVAP